ncbi:LuxR C-terminal-related transcriptional regulator [uncultured Senegalimassilia sp.]|uniref:helix-turn-helix transcriptional regulator n=1 Tax=uncultured Senegalimassilia sp. TaxID=1714350 RepID=UPI0025F2CB15|nr:LuxR C-terminal-related transcriptional regulator [uncultured Senegalimassilia sp.]
MPLSGRKGRTKSYIAETLYLTENTVRSHAKRLYTKLDVHSKQELMDLVEA